MYPLLATRSLFDEVLRQAERVQRQNSTFHPVTDVAEINQGYRVRLELPGVSRDQVAVEIKDRVLTVSGRKEAPAMKDGGWGYTEAAYGEFRRSFQLPETVDADTIEARHEDGVLEVVLRLRSEVGARRIEVR